MLVLKLQLKGVSGLKINVMLMLVYTTGSTARLHRGDQKEREIWKERPPERSREKGRKRSITIRMGGLLGYRHPMDS